MIQAQFFCFYWEIAQPFAVQDLKCGKEMMALISDCQKDSDLTLDGHSYFVNNSWLLLPALEE